MTLQASGAISFADLRDEFGDASGSVSFERYYKGTEGEVPPSYGGGNNPNVPTSGSGTAISLNNFYSAQNIWQTTITSTGGRADKFFSVHGYESDGIYAIGQIGTNGNYLYNLNGELKKAQISRAGAYEILTLQVSANSTVEATAWTTVSFIAVASTRRYARTNMQYSGTGSPIHNFSVDAVAVSARAPVEPPFGPEGTKMKILFENNG